MWYVQPLNNLMLVLELKRSTNWCSVGKQAVQEGSSRALIALLILGRRDDLRYWRRLEWRCKYEERRTLSRLLMCWRSKSSACRSFHSINWTYANVEVIGLTLTKYLFTKSTRWRNFEYTNLVKRTKFNAYHKYTDIGIIKSLIHEQSSSSAV